MANIAGNSPTSSLGYPIDGQPNLVGNSVGSIGYSTSTQLWSSGQLTSGFGDYQQCTTTQLGMFSPSIRLGEFQDTIIWLIGTYSPAIRVGNYQDYLSSFARFFGINAKQDATKLYINKADLPGLNPKANNTAESLLVALLLREMQYESNSLISKVVIEKYKTEILVRNNNSVINHLLLVYLYGGVNYAYPVSGYSYAKAANADQPVTVADFL